MTREEAYNKLGILPCYDEGACISCDDCDFQKAIDIARECLKERIAIDHETMKADFEEIKLRGVDKLEGD